MAIQIGSKTQFVRGIHNTPHALRGAAITIGNFDGVHLGHQHVIDTLKAHAMKIQTASCVMLFEPHPFEKLSPTSAPPARLYPLRQKLLELAKRNVDWVLCQPFMYAFSQLTAIEFIEQVLVEKMAIRHIIVGNDFHFGAHRKGNFDLLQTYAHHGHFSVERIAPFVKGHQRISSTQIRQTLKNAHFQQAQQLLGHPFRLIGRVIHGNHLGQQLGFPTANLHIKAHHLPIQGVYAVRVYTQKKTYSGVLNAGYRPTLGHNKRSIEVHLLNYSGNLYGQWLTIEFLKKLRQEQRFHSLDQLKRAIDHDIAKVAALYPIDS